MAHIVSHALSHITANNLASAVSLRPSIALFVPNVQESGWATELSGHFQQELHLLSLPWLQRQFLRCPRHSLITELTKLSRLLLYWNNQHVTGKDLSHYKRKLPLEVRVSINNHRKELQGREVCAHTYLICTQKNTKLYTSDHVLDVRSEKGNGLVF